MYLFRLEGFFYYTIGVHPTRTKEFILQAKNKDISVPLLLTQMASLQNHNPSHLIAIGELGLGK